MVDLTCKDGTFTFGEKEQASFEALKAAFTQAPVLQYPNQDREFHLETDASEFAVGGVISVKCQDSEFRPVAYMSHSMTPPECNYPIHDKEMLAIIKATEAWCYDFTVSICLWLLCAWHVPFSFHLVAAARPGELTLFLFLSLAHGRYALIGR